jgi:hypothetical protein
MSMVNDDERLLASFNQQLPTGKNFSSSGISPGVAAIAAKS